MADPIPVQPVPDSPDASQLPPEDHYHGLLRNALAQTMTPVPNPRDAQMPPASNPQVARQGPVKGLLGRFLYGGGQAMLHEAGLPTDYELQVRDFNQKMQMAQQQSLEAMRKSQEASQQAEAKPVPLIGQDGKVIVGTDGAPLSLPGKQAGTFYSAMQRAQASLGSTAMKVASGGLAVTPEISQKFPELQGLEGQTIPKPLMDLITKKATAKATSPYGKVSPIIAAQLGPPPDPATEPAKAKLWGAQAEQIQNRMASASGAARGAAFNLSRVDTYVNPDTNELVTTTAGNAMKTGLVKTSPGFQAMSKQAQFKEINTGMDSMRKAISSLDQPFTPAQIAQLNLAARAPDDSVLKTVTESLLGDQSLTPAQQDFVIAHNQMQERLLSLRNVAGIGSSTDSTRRALQATLPNEKTGGKDFALKKLGAVQQQIDSLYGGIPKMPGNKAAAPASGKATHRFNPATGKIEAISGQ